MEEKPEHKADGVPDVSPPEPPHLLAVNHGLAWQMGWSSGFAAGFAAAQEDGVVASMRALEATENPVPGDGDVE